jgi:hypothetical protein
MEPYIDETCHNCTCGGSCYTPPWDCRLCEIGGRPVYLLGASPIPMPDGCNLAICQFQAVSGVGQTAEWALTEPSKEYPPLPQVQPCGSVPPADDGTTGAYQYSDGSKLAVMGTMPSCDLQADFTLCFEATLELVDSRVKVYALPRTDVSFCTRQASRVRVFDLSVLAEAWQDKFQTPFDPYEHVWVE